MAEREAATVIAQAEAADSKIMTRAGRPTYTTKYGAPKTVSTGWKKLPGQPKGGTKLHQGGTMTCSENGGGSFGFTISFPAPFFSIGASFTIGRYGVGNSVIVPGDGFYVAKQRSEYICKPYIVYVTQNGKRSVYRKSVSSVRNNTEIKAFRVG